MWYLAGAVLFSVGAIGMMLAGAVVLDITGTNERHGLPWRKGVGVWVIMGILGFVLEVVGFGLSFWAA